MPSYIRKAEVGNIFPGDKEGIPVKNNAFQKRRAFGEVDELKFDSYLNKLIKKYSLKKIKCFPGRYYQENIMGDEFNTKCDTTVGDEVLSKENSKYSRELLGKFNVKRSTDERLATIAYHGSETDNFNSHLLTFYVFCKDNAEWYAVWGQDLIGVFRDGKDLRTGDEWWSKDITESLKIPFERLFKILINDSFDKYEKSARIESLRKEYHHNIPKSLEQIVEEHKAAQIPKPKEESVKKVEPIQVKTIIMEHNSRYQGKYATISKGDCLVGEASKDKVVFKLNYCPLENESAKSPIYVYFDDIRNDWKNLLVKDAFIKADSVRQYWKDS